MRYGFVLIALSLASLTAGAGELRLVATMRVDPDPGLSSRALFERNGEQLHAGIGDAVGECRLAGVTDKQVLLDCSEEMVTLMLQSGIAMPAPGVDEIATSHYEVSLPRREFLAALDDRQRLASQLSLEPYVRHGFLYGYRVAWLKPGGDFERLGLQTEDVLVSLNGARAAEPATLMQVVNSLGGQMSFDVGVDRDGELISYAYLLE